MKRKSRRGLALALAFVLTGAICMLPVIPVSAETGAGAESTDVKKIVVNVQTTDSITLRAEDNYEYAIETEKDNVKAWKWADAGQYDRVNKTVIFTGLQAGTQYQFACRRTGDTEAVNKTAVQTSAKTETPQAPDSQNPQDIGQGTPGNTPNTDITDVVQTPENSGTNMTDIVQSPQDTFGSGDNGQTISDGIQTSEDDGKTPPDGISNQKEEGRLPENEKKDDNSQAVNSKQTPQLKKPSPPAASEIKDVEITLELPKDADAKYDYEYSNNGIDFQADPVFTGLTEDTEYKFYLRIAAGLYDGVNYPASENSDPAVVKTLKAAPEKPQYPPVLDKKTDTSVTLKTAEDEKDPETLEYGMLTSAADIAWQPSGVFDNLTPGTEYQFVTRRAVNEKEQMQGESSDVLKVATLQSAAAAPASPQLQKRTDTSIILKGATDQQYAIAAADGNVVWQDSSSFGGLTPNTEYRFITRMKFNPDTAMASIASEPAGFKTVVGFSGAEVTGITSGGSYEEGTTLTFTAVGVGMENASPSAGDTRWAPKSWSWDGKSYKNWDKEPYTNTYKYTTPGNYKLRVAYQLEEWTADGWKAMGETNTITTEFKITAKKVIYKITAEAGANGKIEPNGSVDVEKGKDCEFIFTPNKGYRVAKVTVDGKTVSVDNNRYTFTNVQGNHKIYVTFEKDKRTPKTGDTTQVAVFGGLVMVSAVLVIMLAYRKKRHM